MLEDNTCRYLSILLNDIVGFITQLQGFELLLETILFNSLSGMFCLACLSGLLFLHRELENILKFLFDL
jgi:hypothetical protein